MDLDFSESTDGPQRGGRGQRNPRASARGDRLLQGGLPRPRGHSAGAGSAPARPARDVDGHFVEAAAAAAAAAADADAAVAFGALAAADGGARLAVLLARAARGAAAAGAQVVVQPRRAGRVGDVTQPVGISYLVGFGKGKRGGQRQSEGPEYMYFIQRHALLGTYIPLTNARRPLRSST